MRSLICPTRTKVVLGITPKLIRKGSKMIKLLSHLSYVEITSPDVEASVDFYVNQVGLTVVDRVDGAVYLRCWGDYYAYSRRRRAGRRARRS